MPSLVSDYVCILDFTFVNKLHLGSSLRSPSVDSHYRIHDPHHDPAVSLLRLQQGNQAIEEYIEKFCELCNQVDFNDVALKDLFRVGLNEPIRFPATWRENTLVSGEIYWPCSFAGWFTVYCGSCGWGAPQLCCTCTRAFSRPDLHVRSCSRHSSYSRTSSRHAWFPGQDDRYAWALP